MDRIKPVWARGVTKRYGDVLAVTDLDLSVEPGEVRGLIGPNGAGKTTVLAMLFGLSRPDTGSLRVLGQVPAGRANPGVGGFVETPACYPYLSARRNLALLADLDGRPDPARVDEVLHRMGLAEVAEEKVRGYSLGMRQRLGIAAALLREPRLLILDEPTNGLDPAGIREVVALVRELATVGVAVLFSSHRIGDVTELCDTVTILSTGRVAFDGSVAALAERAGEPEVELRTNDDAAAAAITMAGVAVTRGGERCVRVQATQPRLDRYMIELGQRGIAVRSMGAAENPLESLFFALTGSQHPEGEMRDEPDPIGVPA